MVKFGKKFLLSQIPEWKDKYLNYKRMKQLLKQIGTQIPIAKASRDLSLNQAGQSQSQDHVLILNNSNDITHNNNNNNVPSYQSQIQSIESSFLTQLEAELKRVYIHFVNMEKDLYIKINSQLYNKQSYDTLPLDEILVKLVDMCIIIYMAVCLNRFINHNVKAISKLLKKYDKKYQRVFGTSKQLQFFQSKLENKNSDFEYMLQFKVIDETSAIVEQLTIELCNRANSIIALNEPPHPHNDEGQVQVQGDGNGLMTNIKTKAKEISHFIKLIDDEDDYHIKYQEWLYYIRKDDKIIKNNPNIFQNDIYNPMLSSFLIEDSLLMKVLSDNSKIDFIKNQSKLSLLNKSNVILCFVFSFMFSFFSSSIIPSAWNWLEYEGRSEYYGLLMSIVPLCSYLSLLIFQSAFGYSHYKTSLMLSISLLLIGNLLYSLQFSIILVIIGRCLIGLSSNQITVRRYITQFIAKDHLAMISMRYVLISITGFALGPLVSLMALYLPVIKVNEYIGFNEFSYPGWIGVGLSIILMGIFALFFTRPFDDNFQMVSLIKGIDFKGDKICNLVMQQKEAPLITEDEKGKLVDADNRLERLNQKNIFDDANKVPNEIDMIISRQNQWKGDSNDWNGKGQGGLFKAFIALSLFTVTVSFNSELIIVLMSINFGIQIDTQELLYYIYFISGLIIPVIATAVLIKRVMQSAPSWLQIALFYITELLITVSFFVSYLNDLDYLYIPLYIFNQTLNSIIEMIISNLFGNVFPPQWKIYNINCGILLTFGLYLGKILADVTMAVLLLFTSKADKYNDNCYYIPLGISGIFTMCSIVVSWWNRHQLRNKAIARILRNRLLDKLNQ